MYRSPVTGTPMEQITRDGVEGYFDANTGTFYTEEQCKDNGFKKVKAAAKTEPKDEKAKDEDK